MVQQILEKPWCDKVKYNALNVVVQYAEFLGQPVSRPRLKVYDDREMFVPSPEMVMRFVYRVRSIRLRAMIMIAVETGASASEVFGLRWRDVNFASRTLTVHGVKGHATLAYPMSDGLISVLMLLERGASDARIFSHISDPKYINDSIIDYRRRLARETGNPDFLKIHFHTFRHFAISWHYFKTKDIVATRIFARHHSVSVTERYVHIVRSWISENEYDVVYAESKDELSKYLSEGYSFVTKTEWGYCLRRPKMLYRSVDQ